MSANKPGWQFGHGAIDDEHCTGGFGISARSDGVTQDGVGRRKYAFGEMNRIPERQVQFLFAIRLLNPSSLQGSCSRHGKCPSQQGRENGDRQYYQTIKDV